MTDLINALGHAVIYATVGSAMLVLAYYALDLLTPGNLAEHIQGGPDGASGSYSAGVVSAAWLVGNGLVVFDAIWRNGDTSLGYDLGATVAFGLLGIAANCLLMLVVDLVTPGDLRAIICEPGPVRAYALLAVGLVLAVSAVVCASIA